MEPFSIFQGEQNKFYNGANGDSFALHGFIWTECAVIGRSHGKLGRTLVRCKATQFAVAATNHSTLDSLKSRR